MKRGLQGEEEECPLGWGVIGGSYIVERRAAAAILAQEQSQIVAFLSRDRARAAACAGRFGAVRAYDGLWATAMIAGVYESARTGRLIEIPPPAPGAEEEPARTP
jgi:predicted dehydrogenase